ncbi:MAG TPA: hypothetical protein VJ573_00785, partial [Actinomycetota bacterium]|nr:hypothetical protein [Actinomycetota bacterium]
MTDQDAADRRVSAGTRATVLGVAVLVVAVLVGVLVGPVRIGAANVLRWLVSFGDAPQGMSEQQALILADTKCCGQSLETVSRRPGWH